MLDDLMRVAQIPPEIEQICNDLSISICIADPDGDDTPLIYVNRAFETLTLYAAEEVLGKNCRFLQGALTDRTVTDEIAEVVRRRVSETCCLINYRKDGSLFFNLLAIRPIMLGDDRTVLMACQYAFKPTQTAGSLRRTCSALDDAQRKIRFGLRAGPNPVNMHDTYRLDTVAMRFEAAFIRVKNCLIRMGNAQMINTYPNYRHRSQYEVLL